MAEVKKLTVRVLSGLLIDGCDCACGEVIRHDETVLVPLIKSGVVDKNKAGIEYALSQGYEVRDLILADQVEEVKPGEEKKDPPAE